MSEMGDMKFTTAGDMMKTDFDELVSRYVSWKEHALSKYPLPSRLNQNEKEQEVAMAFWSFFWPVVLQTVLSDDVKTIDDIRVIIARDLGEKEASNIDCVRKIFWK